MGCLTGSPTEWVSAACAALSLFGAASTYVIAHIGRPEAHFVPVGHRLEREDVYELEIGGQATRVGYGAHRAFELRNYGDGPFHMLEIGFRECQGLVAYLREDGSFSFNADENLADAGDRVWVFIAAESLNPRSRILAHWMDVPVRLNHCRLQELNPSGVVHQRGTRRPWIVDRILHLAANHAAHRRWHRRTD